jgi:diguanylate cyclase
MTCSAGSGPWLAPAALLVLTFAALWFLPLNAGAPHHSVAIGDLVGLRWSIAIIRADSSVALAIPWPILLLAAMTLWALTSALKPLLVPATEPVGASQPSARDVHKTVSEKLDTSLTTVLETVYSAIAANGRYSNVLAKAENDLSSIVRPEDVKLAVSSLLVENTSMRGEVNGLKDRLEAARTEAQELRSELMSAGKVMFIDHLTGLNNRHWFDSHFSATVGSAQNSTPLCLAFGELDDFEAVNIAFSYQSGDRILRWVGAVFLKHLRRGDSAVRFGSHCFALVMPRKNLRQASEIVESIRLEIQRTRWVHQQSGRDIGVMTASFGLAQLKADECSESLLKRARTNLSSARSAGGNRVVVGARSLNANTHGRLTNGFDNAQ